YARTGHLQAAWKPSHFKAFAEEQVLLARVFGHRVELVSREQQRSEIGSDVYHGLLVDERSGALNPAQYVAGLHEAASRARGEGFESPGGDPCGARGLGLDDRILPGSDPRS